MVHPIEALKTGDAETVDDRAGRHFAVIHEPRGRHHALQRLKMLLPQFIAPKRTQRRQMQQSTLRRSGNKLEISATKPGMLRCNIENEPERIPADDRRRDRHPALQKCAQITCYAPLCDARAQHFTRRGPAHDAITRGLDRGAQGSWQVVRVHFRNALDAEYAGFKTRDCAGIMMKDIFR